MYNFSCFKLVVHAEVVIFNVQTTQYDSYIH